jgi:hypothetical protein
MTDAMFWHAAHHQASKVRDNEHLSLIFDASATLSSLAKQHLQSPWQPPVFYHLSFSVPESDVE